MPAQNYITMDGASFNVAHVLSFESEKAFIDRYKGEMWKKTDVRLRISALKTVYKKAVAITHAAE